MVVTSAACGILIFSWLALSSSLAVAAFSLLYGLLQGTFASLPVTVVAISLCPHVQQLAARLAMYMVPVTICSLTGNLLAGALLNHGWVALQVFSGTIVLFCSLLLVAARISKCGFKMRMKC